MADVLSNYRTGEAFDEMIDGEGSVRPSYKAVYATLQQSSAGELRVIAESLAKNYTRAGVTFDVGGVERPFPLDLVPRVIASPTSGRPSRRASRSGSGPSRRSSPTSTPTPG